MYTKIFRLFCVYSWCSDLIYIHVSPFRHVTSTCMLTGNLIFIFHILVPCFCNLRYILQTYLPLMTIIEMLVRKIKCLRKRHFCFCISCVHFKNSGELKMRFLHVAKFVYMKCILRKIGCLVFIIGVPI